MTTDAQLLAWLKDSTAIRCVLVEVNVKTGGVETTRFLSTKGYVTKPTDTPANTQYSAYITGGVKFTEKLSLDGTASLSFGDIEIENNAGDKDAWLDDVWDNRSIKVFIGDVRWLRADFRQIFDGVVAGVDSKSRNRINLKVSDKLQRLNTPVTENKLGGTTPNADKLVPLCFGEVHNIEPLLVDPTVNEFQVHDGPIEQIIEVRDNGVPVAFTPFLTTGKFRLAKQPSGQITASVQGAQAQRLLGPEQIVGGDFGPSLTGWTQTAGPANGIAAVNNELQITKTATGESSAKTTITGLTVGKRYAITATGRIVSGFGDPYIIWPQYYAWVVGQNNLPATFTFVATAVTQDFEFRCGGGGNPVGVMGFSNVKCVEDAGLNVVVNGNFSNGGANWSTPQPATTTWSVVNGELFITGTASGDRVEEQSQTMLVPGQEYNVTGTIRAVSGTLYFRVLRGASAPVPYVTVVKGPNVTATTTTPVSFTFVAPGPDCIIQCCTDVGSGYFDNVEIRPTANMALGGDCADTSFWTAARSTLSVVNGAIRVTNVGGDSSMAQVYNTVPGNIYELTFTAVANSTGAGFGRSGVQIQDYDSRTAGIQAWTMPGLVPGTYKTLYRASANQTTVLLANYNTAVGAWADFDNVSFKDVTNKVTNGQFFSLGGWVNPNPNGGGALVEGYNGRLRITNVGNLSSRVTQTFTTVPGRKYLLSADCYGGATQGASIAVNPTGSISTTGASFGGSNANQTVLGSEVTITATGTQTTVLIYVNVSNGTNAYAEFDNVSFKEVYTDAGYFNTAEQIIEYITTRYGNALNRFSYTDLDIDALLAFDIANPQPLGVYLNDRTNVIDVCNMLASSVGGRLLISRAGLMTLIKLAIPQALPGTSVTPTDIVSQSLAVSQFPAVQAGVQIGYCKNWTVQTGGSVAAGVPLNNADLYGEEWLTVTRTDTLAQADRKTFVDPVMVQTYLLTAADATAEANRRLNMWNVQRKVFKYVGMPWLMLETLGGSQTITNSRFGLDSGKTGQIISLATDWLNPHITVEVLI